MSVERCMTFAIPACESSERICVCVHVFAIRIPFAGMRVEIAIIFPE